jgi:hypothetical protein
MEGRGLVEGNLRQQNAFRTQCRVDVPSALERVRAVARKDKDTRFTALFQYVYDLKMLEWAFFQLKKEAAPGVDGETWQHYLEDLEQNLQALSARLQRGAYRAKPVRRTYIPKSDGRQRPPSPGAGMLPNPPTVDSTLKLIVPANPALGKANAKRANSITRLILTPSCKTISGSGTSAYFESRPAHVGEQSGNHPAQRSASNGRRTWAGCGKG